MSCRLRQWRRGIGRALFNLVNPALAAVIAVGSAQLAGIERGGWVAPLAIAVAALAYYVANVGVIALNIAAHTGMPLRQIVRDSLWSAPTTIVVGLIGGFVGVAHERLGLLGIGPLHPGPAGAALHAGLRRAQESPGDRDPGGGEGGDRAGARREGADAPADDRHRRGDHRRARPGGGRAFQPGGEVRRRLRGGTGPLAAPNWPNCTRRGCCTTSARSPSRRRSSTSPRS